MAGEKSEILPRTLDSMALKPLSSMGPSRGCETARRIEQISKEALLINQGTICASLIRLFERGWISGRRWTLNNIRKAEFYSITKTGRKRVCSRARNSKRVPTIIVRGLPIAGQG